MRRGVFVAAVDVTETGDVAEVEVLVRDALAELETLPEAERDATARQLASEIVSIGRSQGVAWPRSEHRRERALSAGRGILAQDRTSHERASRRDDADHLHRRWGRARVR
jgi:hypothetical protein